MAIGNRALILVLAVVALVAIGCSFALDWTGKSGAAAYIGLAAGVLGIVCPSPFRHAPLVGGPGAAAEGSAESGGNDGS